jgi:hypothetical protein
MESILREDLFRFYMIEFENTQYERSSSYLDPNQEIPNG